MFCDRCNQCSHNVSACAVPAMAVMQIQRAVPRQGGLVGLPPMSDVRVEQHPFAFQTTMFLCQACNRNRLEIELSRGPMQGDALLKWLKGAPKNDSQAELPLKDNA